MHFSLPIAKGFILPHNYFVLILAIDVTLVLTCPSFPEMFDIVVLCENRVERLRPSASEAPLLVGPAGKILFITKENAIQKAHQVAGVLPHFTTQLLESQVWNNCCVVIQHFSVSDELQTTAVFLL